MSASLFDITGNCDVSNYALHTNVLMFSEWMKNPLKRSSLESTSSTLAPKVGEENCGLMSESMSLIHGGSSA